MADLQDPSKHPDFYTWTWDVWVSGGNWRAEYGWEKPVRGPRDKRIIRNVRPLFTHPAHAGAQASDKERAARTELHDAISKADYALWVMLEHSTLHHGDKHSSVTLAREALNALRAAVRAHGVAGTFADKTGTFADTTGTFADPALLDAHGVGGRKP